MSLRTLLIGAASVGLFATGAQAADLMVSPDVPAIEAATFDWARPYVGVAAGIEKDISTEEVTSFDVVDDEDIYGSIGAFAGINFLPSAGFLLGIEGSLDYVSNGDESYIEAFVLGRAGVVVAPQLLLYAVAGVGLESALDSDDTSDDAVYQLGVGAEIAVTDSVTVRAQLTGYGYFDNDGDDLFDYLKPTIGVSFHF